MSHLSDDRLSALADGALDGETRAAAERHLESCARCRGTLAGLTTQDRALRAALDHDPGEAYFESFAGRVGGRLRAAGLRGAQARGSDVRSLADWFRSPRKLALVGAVATVVAGAGIVMLSTREVRVPALREEGPERRVAQQAAPGPAQPAGQAPGGVTHPPAPRALAAAPAPAGPAGQAATGLPNSPAPALAPTASPRAGTELAAREVGTVPAAGAVAPRARAYQVRRNESGEDVAVSRPGEFAYRPPRAAPEPPPTAAGEVTFARKRPYAEPLKSVEPQGGAAGAARPAPVEALAPAPAAEGTAGAERGAVSEAESKSAPVRSVVPGVSADREQGAPRPGLNFLGLQGARPAREGADPFDGLPTESRMLARNARRLTALAAAVGVAPAWDSAATEWERVIEGAQGGPLESEIRFQFARARAMAWRRGANPRRAARAAGALDAFLAHVPPGAERDSALAWRGALK